MAIIGLGRMGMSHADMIMNNRELKLLAVSKKNPEGVEELRNRYNVEVFTDNDKLLNMKELDFIVIATTNETHQEIAIKAIKKGKNVIVEKPMALNYKGAQEMIKTAEKYGRHLFVYDSTLWDSDFLFVKNTIESGKLGKILAIQSKWIVFGAQWAGWGIHGMDLPWRIKAEYGGGILTDLGYHLILQLLKIVKKDPSYVYGMFQSGLWSTEVEDHFFSIIKFDDDMMCQIESSNNCRLSLPRWFIVGTKGTLRVNGSLEEIYDEVELSYEDNDGKKKYEKIKLKNHPGAGLAGGFYEDLVSFLDGKKEEFISVYDSAKTIKVIDLIKSSNKENKFICFK